MKKIVVYGDSIAAGLFQGETTEILDMFILDELKDMGYPDYSIVNMGVRGASTSTALEGFPEAVGEQADFYVLIVGINDAINIKDNIPQYQENLKTMIGLVDPAKVIFTGPSYVDPVKKPQVDVAILADYVTAAKEVAEETGAKFIDMYHHMTVYPATEEFLSEDGLHPSRFGYHLYGGLIARDIKNKLQG